MTMPGMTAERRLQRFLSPKYAANGEMSHAFAGRASTPAADAVCELYINVDDERIVDMRFALYGPPVAVVCADWLCEYATGRTIKCVCGLSSQDMHAALALAPEERFGAILALDALTNAMTQMES